MLKFLPIAALLLSVSAVPPPSAANSQAAAGKVKPLTVANGVQCFQDDDCANGYCYVTPASRASSRPVGTCKYPNPNGSFCYKDSGCLSGNCENSKCQTPTPTTDQVTCVKSPAVKGIMYLGLVAQADYNSTIKQPYLTFNGHYTSKNIDGPYNAASQTYSGKYEEVLTTSGSGHKLPVELWQCNATAGYFPLYDALAQLRIASGPFKGQCIQGAQQSIGSPPSPDSEGTVLSTFSHAPCSFDAYEHAPDGSGRYSNATMQQFQYTLPEAGATDLSIPIVFYDNAAPALLPASTYSTFAWSWTKVGNLMYLIKGY